MGLTGNQWVVDQFLLKQTWIVACAECLYPHNDKDTVEK